MTPGRIELTVVVPMYNEQEVLPLLVDRLRPVLDGLDTAYEVLCVDDGSRRPHPRAAHAAVAESGLRCAWCGCVPTPGTRPRSPPAWTWRPATTWSPSTPTCRTRPRSSPTCSPRHAGTTGRRRLRGAQRPVDRLGLQAGVGAGLLRGHPGHQRHARAQRRRRLPADVPCDGRRGQPAAAGQPGPAVRRPRAALPVRDGRVQARRAGRGSRPSTRSSRCCGSRSTQ